MNSPKLPHHADYLALGRGLSELRHGAGLTQVQAAQRVGVRSRFVSELERGNRGPRWHTLLLMLRAYDADLHDLADAISRAEAN